MAAFPKISKVIDETEIMIEQRFLVEKYNLVLDRLKCVGCGQCTIVCPKEAIRFGPVSALYKGKGDLNLSLEDSVDPNKCVYCGTCVYFCPFDALHLYINDEKVPINELKISTERALPELVSKEVFCDRLKRNAKVYWEGTIEVTYKVPEDRAEFKSYYMNKCPGDCRECESICPTQAISFKSEEEGWKTKQHIVVDDEKCIKCGACMLVCPQSNFKVEWTEIHTKGAYNSIFWDPIKERLLKQELRFTEENKE